MFELFPVLPVVIGLVALAIGLWIGIGLGKRSERANAIYDSTRAKTDRLAEQMGDKYDEAATKIRDSLDD